MDKTVVPRGAKTFFAGLVFVLVFSCGAFAQKKKPTPRPTPKPTPAANLPKVTQIDEVSIKTALKANGKPLLVNFWATWCVPCVEEFPDLVKLNAEYKGKIDLITISLDDLAEINRDVPKFLLEMKAEMPAYLLRTADENAVITSITKDWQGGLPFTILYNEKGELAYFKQGKIIPELMRAEIEKLLAKPVQTTAFERGKADARKDLISGNLVYKANYFGRRAAIFRQELKENYGINIEVIEFTSNTPADNRAIIEYTEGYNSIAEIEIGGRFGQSLLKEIKAQFPQYAIANVVELTLTLNRKP